MWLKLLVVPKPYHFFRWSTNVEHPLYDENPVALGDCSKQVVENITRHLIRPVVEYVLEYVAITPVNVTIES